MANLSLILLWFWLHVWSKQRKAVFFFSCSLFYLMGSVRPGSLNWTASRLDQGLSGKICLTIKKLLLLRKRLWHQWAPATRQTSDPQFYDFHKGCLSLLATAYVLPKSLCWYFLKIFAFGLVSFFNFLLISAARCSDRKANAWSPKQRCVIATEWQLSALSECSSPNKFSLISRAHWWDSRADW